MNTRLVLGVGRHAGTEVAGTGASPGTRFLFSSMEENLRRQFKLVPVPSYYYSTDARCSLRVAIDVLSRVDACIFGLPPGPFDLDPFFLVRERMKKLTPFVYMPLGEFPRGAWHYRNIHRHLRAQDLILFSSRSDKAVHDALVASTPARVVVVSFGIRPESFRTSAGMRLATRRHLGIDRDQVVFVYHGRVTAEKNVHSAIMMFRRIARDHPRTRLWIIGEGEHGAQPDQLTTTFRELLRGEALEDRVMFWGGLSPEALPRILAAADIGVNFTLNADENFGYSVVEAMASGLPVIGTDWGGLKDTIEDGVTGFLVPTVVTSTGVAVDHWTAWRRALALVDNAAERKRMGEAAERRVARVFDLKRFVNSVAREIRAQISSNGTRRQTRHVWSPLGKRLLRRYSTAAPVAGDRARVLPSRVPVGATQFRDHPLMRRVLAPYATGTQSDQPGRQAVFFLATELLAVRSTSVVSKDPRYVFKLKPVTAVDRAVICVLRAHGFCDRSSLAGRVAPRFGERSIRASLHRLLRAGILLQSEGPSRARGRGDIEHAIVRP